MSQQDVEEKEVERIRNTITQWLGGNGAEAVSSPVFFKWSAVEGVTRFWDIIPTGSTPRGLSSERKAYGAFLACPGS